MFYAFCVGQEPELRRDGGEFLKGQIGPLCFCGGIFGFFGKFRGILREGLEGCGDAGHGILRAIAGAESTLES